MSIGMNIRMSFNITGCIFLFFLLAVSNYACAEEILLWEDCVGEAKQNHPDLISAEEKINEAKANKDIARSNILPQINGDLDASTSKKSAGGNDDNTNTDKQINSYSYGITGSQLLFDGLKTSYDISSAREKIKSTEYDYDVTSSNIRLRLMTAFVSLLTAQEYLKVAEDIADRRKKNVDLVDLRYEGGREHRGSLLTAQADLAQALYDVSQARRAIFLSQRRLVKELGRKNESVLAAKGDFIVKEAEKERPDFEQLAETNPFLKDLIVRKEASRYDLKSARAEYFPQVYASGSAGMNDTTWPPEQSTWSIGLSASLPIFEGGLRTANVSKAKAMLNQAQAEERSGRDSVIFTLADTWTKLQDAVENVGVQAKFLQASQERAKISEAEYSNGLLSFDNWIIIEDNLVTAKKKYLDAQASALIAEANWVQTKGGTLDYDEKK